MRVRGPDGAVIEFPDDTPPETIKAAMERHYSQADRPAAAPPPRLTEATGQNDPTFDMGHLNMGPLRALPSIGGGIGGLAGGGVGPLSYGGAAAGGAAGEGFRQFLTGEKFSPAGIGREAGLQAGSQVVGGVIGKGLSKLGPPLMQKALGVTEALAERFNTTKEEIAKFVLEKRWPVTASGKNAAQSFGKAVATSRAGAIARTPGRVGPQTISLVAIEEAEKQLGRRLTISERGRLVRTIQNEANDILTEMTHGAVPKGGRAIPAQPPSKLVDQFGQPAIPGTEAVPAPASRYSSRELQQIKEVSQQRARTAYAMNRAGTSTSSNPQLDEQLGAAALAALEKRVPGIAAHNAELQQIKAAKLAIRSALGKSGEWTPLHVGPVALGFKIPKDKIGNLALLLTSQRVQRIARQSPRAFVAALQQLNQSAEPEATQTYP